VNGTSPLNNFKLFIGKHKKRKHCKKETEEFANTYKIIEKSLAAFANKIIITWLLIFSRVFEVTLPIKMRGFLMRPDNWFASQKKR
tara:strand:- start:59 stop:316 length:258 start_codon:yes stop_codon:yes gene_type:complete